MAEETRVSQLIETVSRMKQQQETQQQNQQQITGLCIASLAKRKQTPREYQK
jgi:hypothetical protein